MQFVQKIKDWDYWIINSSKFEPESEFTNKIDLNPQIPILTSVKFTLYHLKISSSPQAASHVKFEYDFNSK